MITNVGWDAIIYGSILLAIGIVVYFVIDKFTHKGVQMGTIHPPAKKKVKI